MSYPIGSAAHAIEIAKGEIGYVETPENITKYGEAMKAKSVPEAFESTWPVVPPFKSTKDVSTPPSAVRIAAAPSLTKSVSLGTVQPKFVVVVLILLLSSGHYCGIIPVQSCVDCVPCLRSSYIIPFH